MSKRSRSDCESEFDVAEFMVANQVDEEYMILGIDEAGRGPVIGSMVYTGAIISLKEHDSLISLCNVADSKVLSESSREASLVQLSKLSTFHSFTENVTAVDIAETMSGRSGRTLNTLSHEAAISIIRKATLFAKGKLVAVFVDTVGIVEVYQKLLSGRFPHLRVTVAKKADSKFPIVSAASIVAKTTRDNEIRALGIACGSGYPSDPAAKAWIAKNLHKYFSYTEQCNFVRHSWGPVQKLCKAACVNIEFEQDSEKDKDTRQLKLSFAKPPPRRDSIFSHTLGLRSTMSIE